MRALRILERRVEALSERARALCAAGLGEGAARAVRVAFELGDAEAARALAAVEARPACAAGCAWCCHVNVDATAPEIDAVAASLRSTLTRDDLRALRDRLDAHAACVSALDDEARWAAHIPCALLDAAGRCSVHPARPLRCRAFHSCSAEPCRAAFAGDEREPTIIPALARAMAAVEEGYDRALRDAGIDGRPITLEIGLAAALRDL